MRPLRAGGADQPRRESPHGDRDPADRTWLPRCAAAVALPWGWYRVLYESPAGKNALPTFTQDGSGQHVIIASGSQTGWIRAGELIFLRAPASTPDFFPGITIAG